MKKSSTVFLQVVIVLIGIGALALLLWEPQIEGRNAHVGFSEAYLNDSFLVYVYAASIAFFVALAQAFKVLGYIRHDKTFSREAVKALRTIKYCALVLIGFVAVSVFFMIGGDREDRPGGLFMRILVTFPAIIVATAAAVSERVLQNAVNLKSENDLTV